MKNINLLSELKEADILIAKHMFYLCKDKRFDGPPSPLQFEIISFLLKSKDEVCQRDLEKNLRVSKATISGALHTMERKGIVQRITSPVDTREKVVTLTSSAEEKFKQMKEINKKINRVISKDITEEELEMFTRVLAKIKKNIIEEGKEKIC